LAVIAARGRNQPFCLRMLTLETFDIDKPATHLEGAGRRVVLMLDDDARTQPLGKQRPGMRCCRRHRAAYDFVGAFEFGEVKHDGTSPLPHPPLCPLSPPGGG